MKRKILAVATAATLILSSVTPALAATPSGALASSALNVGKIVESARNAAFVAGSSYGSNVPASITAPEKTTESTSNKVTPVDPSYALKAGSIMNSVKNITIAPDTFSGLVSFR